MRNHYFRIENKLKDHNLERVMIDGKRHYITPSGEKYPSVTTVLSSLKADSIREWRERVGAEEANRISSKASARGTHVHSILEKYLMNRDDYLDKAMPSNIESFKRIQGYLDKWCDIVYANEITLFSHELKTAGQCDLVGRLHGINTIIDFKTSVKEKKEEWITDYFYQATAYALMLKERENFVCPQICILISSDEAGLQFFIRHTAEYITPVKDIFKQYHERVDRIK